MEGFDLGHVLEPRMSEAGNARGAKALSISIVFTCLASFFMICRFYARVFMVKRTGPDDWMALVSLSFSIIFMGLFIGEKKYGLGNHMVDIPPHIMKKQMICFWLSVPMYNSSLFCTKASIVLQYFRVFPGKSMRIACYGVLGFLLVYGVWAVLSAYLNCIPVAKFWDDSIDGHCINMEALWFSNAIVHIITDVVILSMPMPTLNSLQLPKKQKLALMAVFALGGFVCITSGLRLQSLQVIARSTDKTWDNVGAAYWSAIECNTGIICCCLPSLRPVISYLFPRLISSTRSNPSKTGGTHRSTHHNASTVETGGYGMQSLHDRSTDDGEFDKLGGIKVTREFGQESVGIEDSSSERKLVFSNPA
ncbi:hypothetical protein FQN54_000922 [Arachnomyces sp. PD_36]|nr:hypothetical protein FQN54_000922 [Arachnomyces sp. PD_36]